MGVKIVLFMGFIFSLAILWHRDRADHRDKIHYQSIQPIQKYNNETNHGYTIGSFNDHPKQKQYLGQLLSYKKINNYVFVGYNIYKVEFAFIDLGYTSLVQFTMFAQNFHYFVQQNIGFRLPAQRFDGMNFYFQKRQFNLTVRQHLDEQNDQTYTIFNLSINKPNCRGKANLTHIMKNKQCFSTTRSNNVLSHKCYGGLGEGRVGLQTFYTQQNMKKYSSYNFSLNLTRVLFDGLRGSGMHWKWVWATASGFNKKQYYSNHHTISLDRWLGFNFGKLDGEGEDFIFWAGQIIPVQGMSYEIDQNFQQNSQIIFKGEQPKFEFKFKVFHKNIISKDMLIAKVDMIKAEGFWQGWIDIQGKRNQFELIAGLVETSDSLF